MEMRSSRSRLALLCLVLTAAAVFSSGPLSGQTETSRLEEYDLPSEDGVDRPPPRRTTIAPWSTDVLGKSYESFTNEEASRVLNDWLINALMAVPVFNVVNRDKISAALSEKQLVTSGYARDVSETALADAGKILKVNYILLGNFKNLGKMTEVDFKLLDVDTATYAKTFNFSIPFNPALEQMKSEIDSVVATLATEFPIEADLIEVQEDGRVVAAAGELDGVTQDLEAEIWSRETEEYLGSLVAKGYVAFATARTCEIALEGPPPEIDIFEHVARLKIVPPAQAALARGLRFFRDGAWAQAADSFRKGLDLDPDNGVLHAHYARALWRVGDYDGAASEFRRAIELRPDDSDLLEDASAALFEAGRVQEVLHLLEPVGRAESSLSLILLKGQAYEIQGRLDLAQETYMLASRRDPSRVEPHIRLAVNAIKRSDLDTAEREIRVARDAGIDTLEQRVVVAVFGAYRSGAQLSGGPTSALLEEARSARDFQALTTAGELMLLLDSSAWTEALQLARESLAVNPSYLRSILLAARAMDQGGQLKEARREVAEAEESFPNSLALLFLDAGLALKDGDEDTAEACLRQAREVATTDWRAAEALGKLYFSQGKFLDAASEFQSALEVAEGSGRRDNRSLLLDLGRSLVVANQHGTAAPYLERCVAADPAQKACHFYLGQCYFQEATPEAADKAVRAFQAAEGFPDRFYYLGVLNDRLDQVDTARGAYEACVLSSCTRADESQRRIDEIDSITGRVENILGGDKKPTVLLNVGSIHGVRHGMTAIVVSSGTTAQLEVVQVQEGSSVAVVSSGGAQVGQLVRFRPSRPKDVSVRPADKKGAEISWRASSESEVVHYLVFRSEKAAGPWGRYLKKVRRPERQATDRSTKPGVTYYYRVTAVAKNGAESLPSVAAEFAAPLN